MVMIFSSEKPREFLFKNRYVLTWRKVTLNFERKLGKEWITNKRCGKKIADVIVSIVTKCGIPPSEFFLKDYVFASGFQTATEWRDEILKLNKPDPDIGLIGNIYCVILKKKL